MKKVVTFGEIMLRLSTNDGERLSSANTLHMHYGGGEANVAIALAGYGFHTYFVSKVPDNPLGKGVYRHLHGNGVSTDFLLSGGQRLGTYYLETGSGERSPHVTYDRKYSSFSEITGDELNLETILAEAAIFHVSGITLALSESLRELVLEAVKTAKRLGVQTSFDFNYRATLWSQEEAAAAIKPILPYVDICSCGELDAIHLLGIPKAKNEWDKQERLVYYYEKINELYPNIAVMASTFRTVHSASRNELQGNLFMNGKLYQSKVHDIQPIVDRVGGGDAFASGILCGLLEEQAPDEIVAFATAASALKHTIYGDCSQFTQKEITRFIEAGSGRISR
ncbi:sugar kinase [Niallia circulans]|uniref:Sugar kinase n=1 Tax=Niallia circulans TaxID=1397 RepID=A0A553SLU3_NIACI|nr:sugar kinase [Niallia circulans]TRZ37956.1 sugar kinase [Niallia circulans]